MDNRQHTGDSAYSVESIRAYEVRRLHNKLSLSPEQRGTIEKLSRSLVEELVHGPIARTIAKERSICQERDGASTE